MKLTEMTISDLQSRYAVLKDRAVTINEQAEAEKRDLNGEEKDEWSKMQAEMNGIKRELEVRASSKEMTEQIAALEAAAGLSSVFPSTPERRAAAQKFRALIERGGKDVELELRASVTATGTSESAAAISILAQDFIEPLNKGLIMNQLGLRMKEGLTANVKYPIMPTFEAKFVNEKETVADTTVNETALQPTPRRIAISVPLTDLANVQTDGKLYSWIIDNLAVAMARTLNRWMFQATPIITGVYGPMAYDSSKNAVKTLSFAGDVPTFKELLAMRGMVQGTGAYNDGTYGYVMSGAMAATLEATPRFDNGDTPVIVDSKIAGCPVMMSEYIEATGDNTFNAKPLHVGFGRWSDVIVGQFGTLKLTVDPYSDSKSGVTNIVLNGSWSVDMIRKESFVIGTVKTT